MNNMAEDVRLTVEQQEAIDEIDRNLQIIACAGSGKTEVISRRIANILKSKPDVTLKNIVAFTFTEKAAASLKMRIAKALGLQMSDDIEDMYVGTIHGFCHHILCEYTEKFSEYRVLDSVKNHLFVTRYHEHCGMSDLKLVPYPSNVNLFVQCIEKMIDDYDNREDWTQEQRDVLDKYRNCLYEHEFIDFSMMIFEALQQIKNNSNVAEYLSQIKYLVVDEYQDVNDMQEKLISEIAKKGANVCVVGDDDQTIYQFRGSNANNMITFSERYQDIHQVRLEKNFRCSTGIVDIADCVIKNNQRRLPKKMISEAADADGIIVAKRYSDKNEEFTSIAEEVSEIHESGVPYRDMAILVRKGKVIPPMSQALRQADIPFETDSAEHFFDGSYFERFVETLRILTNVDKAKLYDCWSDIAERDAINRGFKYLRSCSRGGKFALSEIIQEFCDKIDFLNDDADDIELRCIDLDGIKKILSDYDEIYGDWQLTARVDGVLRFLGTRAADEYKYHSFKPKDPDEDAVQIMTVHKAKGLEFGTVFLPELVHREFPVSNIGGQKYYHVLRGTFDEKKEKYQSDMEDERKLFYVAVTRAKQNLFMHYELSTQPVSCFVKEAAASSYLEIDRSDLTYNPKTEFDDFDFSLRERYKEEIENWRNDDESCISKQEYWTAVKYARGQLYDYYGTASHFCPGAGADLVRIKNMSPDEILTEASLNGLI